MPFEWIVALRFLREGRAQTILILAGVSVGVGVMVFLSALMNGLQTSLIERTLGSQAHIVVKPPEEIARVLDDGDGPFTAAHVEKSLQKERSILQYQQALAAVESVPGVVTATPTVAGSGFATRGNVSKSVALRGIEPSTFDRIINVSKKMRKGRFHITGTECAIGVELADQLGITVGDKLRILSTEERSEVYTVIGVFDLGQKDVNERWVFMTLRSAQTMLDLVGAVSTIEVKIDRIFEAKKIAEAIASRTGLEADSWMTINKELLVGLKSQDSSQYMIQFFVIVAVALGIASVLVVSVVQKSREIGILKTVGTQTSTVLRIFLIQGGLLGLGGSVIGSALGAALAIFFSRLALHPDGSPVFPVDLNLVLFTRAAFIATFTGLAASLVPARRAARLDPAVVIRYG